MIYFILVVAALTILIAYTAAVVIMLNKLGQHGIALRPRDVKHIEAYTNAQAKNKYMED